MLSWIGCDTVLAIIPEWHQYDDIICKKPGVLKKATNWWNDNLRKDLVAGKHMAAEIMLDRIFSILQTWNLINLRNFFAQFMQFHFVIREPVVYEGKKEIWSDLQYKVEEVGLPLVYVVGLPEPPARSHREP